MTDQQHPGGVAGRVLQELQRYKETTPYSEPDQQREFGAKQMHEELSREARAILTEWRHELMHDPELDDAREASLQQGTPEYWALKNAFTRLGLDLESEDE